MSNQYDKNPNIYRIKCLVIHYFLDFKTYEAASGGVFLRYGTPRTLQKYAEVGQGPCKACQGVAKQAYTS